MGSLLELSPPNVLGVPNPKHTGQEPKQSSLHHKLFLGPGEERLNNLEPGLGQERKADGSGGSYKGPQA